MDFQPLEIYEINTATWLYSLGQKYSRNIDLSNVPNEEWERIGSYGFSAVWLMGIWQRSPAAIEINRKNPLFTDEMKAVLPDFNFKSDVIGSAYSIRSYQTNELFGGDKALIVAKHELNRRGMKLILDYIPNHLALDHSWAKQHPEYFVHGSKEDLINLPGEFITIGSNIYALGRDPSFEPWSDVLQLNVFSPELREASKQQLLAIAEKCDGVRCDMAMLVTNLIFQYTWQTRCGKQPKTEYWEDLINATRAEHANFIFIAEAYWDSQKLLLEQGFNYCYDKDFYDFLKSGNTNSLRNHFLQPVEYQNKLVHFLENHDEPRAGHVFSYDRHLAAAIMLATAPGARMYYEGQFKGARKRTPVQLARDPAQTANAKIQQFYSQYIEILRSLRHDQSSWSLCRVTVPYYKFWMTSKSIFAWGWKNEGSYYLAIINYSGKKSNPRVMNPWVNVDITKSQFNFIFRTHEEPQARLKYVAKSIDLKLSAYEALIIQMNPD